MPKPKECCWSQILASDRYVDISGLSEFNEWDTPKDVPECIDSIRLSVDLPLLSPEINDERNETRTWGEECRHPFCLRTLFHSNIS